MKGLSHQIMRKGSEILSNLKIFAEKSRQPHQINFCFFLSDFIANNGKLYYQILVALNNKNNIIFY